jgi:subtilisin family serine protease
VLSYVFAYSQGVDKPTFGVPDKPPAAKLELLVKYKASASPQAVRNVNDKFQLLALRKFKVVDVHHVKLTAAANFQQVLTRLQQDPDVEYVEENHLWYAQRDPNDPQFSQLWGLARIQAARGWDRVSGSPNVVVAVIDTGIDYNHPDLAANMWRNPGEIPGNGRDDDGNGIVDDVFGADFINDDGDPRPDNRFETHGTHVGGTIAAVGDNRAGVVGTTWRARIMALKFLGNCTATDCTGSTADAIQAIDYAVAKGAHIMNNSWGGGPFSRALRDAIQRANEQGILFVAAAGNGGSDSVGDNNDRNPYYPASYNVPNVIAVAATNQQDRLAGFSNFGRTSVHLAAPGVSILSTVPGSNYGSMNGTSMATPHVSGVAVLLKGLHPSWNARELRDQLIRAVDPVEALRDRTVTGGRLNLARAVGPAEDCIAYDPRNLRVVAVVNKGYKIVDGDHVLFMLSDRDDAHQLLNIAKQYTATCFIGRDNRRPDRERYIAHYFKGNSGIRTTVTREDCIAYSPGALQIRNEGSQGWLLTDGRSRMVMLDDQRDADAALDVARQHRAQCFVGRGNGRSSRANDVVGYWR